jgi:hypothetical protein
MGETTWEGVAGEPGRADYTDRLRVPGGWLYRTRAGGGAALAFVPAPDQGAGAARRAEDSGRRSAPTLTR